MMHSSSASSAALLGLLLAGCQSGSGTPPSAWGPWTTDAATLAAVAAHDDLVLVHRDLALQCPSAEPVTHRVGGGRCTVSRIGPGGALSPTDIEQVLFVQRLDEDRVLAGTVDLQLQLLLADGSASPVARGVLDPRVADDRRHVAWVELLEPAPVYEMGAPTRVVLWDAIDDARWVVSEDASDSSPVPVPESQQVLLVSRRSGLASYWLVGPQQPPQQLTNVGLRSAGEGFVPVHSGELVWLPEQRRAVYSADYGEPQLWLLDLDGEGARPLGPGRLPALRRGGGVLAVTGEGADLQVVEYGPEMLR
ncbi:MAG: hypothetical protein AB1Z98_13020 [Nannocystaceae bacterium]